MIPAAWRAGEVAVVGLARSGAAVTRWLRAQGVAVYGSDAADTPGLRAAAAPLRDAGAVIDLGRHDLARIARAAAVVISPGVPPDAPPLQAARNAGREVVAEVDVAARALADTRVIAVTGTNGKTTTTALIAHVLGAAGVRAEAGGNIGRPLIDLAALRPAPAWAVVEVSSFQLHDAPHLAPDIGILTNLSPNHLDRYRTVEDYYGDKRLLFRNATGASVWIVNGDDPAALALAADAPGVHRRFRGRGHADAWYDRGGNCLVLDGVPLLARAALPLLGDHNVENALAAALAARAAGAEVEAIARGLRTFRPLAHRLELVRELRGVRWINDSKATSVAAARVAMAAMDRPFVWLAGGRHKGEPYTALGPLLARARGVVVYGESAARIVADLPPGMSVTTADSLDAAVRAAAAQARPGDAVLLSPACSSYDMFESYEHRGARFRELVDAL